MSRRRTRLLLLAAGIAAVAVAGFLVVGLGGQQLVPADDDIPTAAVRRGRVELDVYATGELRPTETAMLVAPSVRGTLQIVRLLPSGTLVEPGDVVIEFDPTEQEYILEQRRFEVLEAEQEITKRKADAEVQAAQDKVTLLAARFAARRAELEVSRGELLSAIDRRKNELTLEEARRRLEQLEQDAVSRAVSNEAALRVLEERRNEALAEMRQAQDFIEAMQLRSPIRGLVAVKENQDASGGFFFSGMTLPEYREGDQVNSGRFIAEVLGTDEMQVLSQVDESSRANLTPGQPVTVRMDGMPDAEYTGKLKSVAGMVSRSGGIFSRSTGPVRMFDITITLEQPDQRLRPGISGQVVIQGQELDDALYLPRQAVFEQDGKQVVYVRAGSRFEPREVQVKHRTESRAVIEGLPEGTEVALVNPQGSARQPGKAPPAKAPSLTGGGRGGSR